MSTWTPVVDVSLLVRRPSAEVYEAFADPGIIRKFWLAHSSGRLETGARVRWAFKIAGAETDVEVIAAEPGRRLDLRWDDGQPLTITFEDRGDATVVRIRVAEFGGDEPAAVAVETMSGFTLVLASVKMLLEHGIEGDLMYDRFPDADYADAR
ncbi:SRPBCC domain-containing protein [Paractinoplanes hotanensis]|uniref:SRPBCC domain-containing protein n=1 Tax=Paractinoplanes hotanensis TaxID=2906497 RepID=A0ABT0Y2J3_9ACTN|nr:SRPBCC domain-containing protein [Actinoplanes hotanensis]MCM4080217.1 SRPBCC domain-containing protein [Actinoplanes hotanensis]